MKLNWAKWGLEFWRSVVRHASSCGISYFAVIETQNLPFAWKGFFAAVGVGGLLRGALQFFSKSPTPEDEDQPKGPNE